MGAPRESALRQINVEFAGRRLLWDIMGNLNLEQCYLLSCGAVIRARRESARVHYVIAAPDASMRYCSARE